jgi:hypothetical protein
MVETVVARVATGDPWICIRIRHVASPGEITDGTILFNFAKSMCEWRMVLVCVYVNISQRKVYLTKNRYVNISQRIGSLRVATKKYGIRNYFQDTPTILEQNYYSFHCSGTM